MHLTSLQLINFKNYEEAEMSLCAGINCFVGLNGSGKTNILDAVHYLSMCKSYMNPIDRQNIRFDQLFFSLLGIWEKEGKSMSVHCALKSGAKKVVKLNKIEYEKLSEHIGKFPSVMISPYDKDLLSEGSEVRRKWIDGIISQFDKVYLSDIQKYSKVLVQRNATLKNIHHHGLFDRDSIEVWNDQLVELGQRIHQTRTNFLEEFIPVFQLHYNQIGNVTEEVYLEYRSQLNDQSFRDLLVENERKDIYFQYTNAGIHKDDLVFKIKNHLVKKFGSQGQQKSFVIALRLAQYEWLKRHLNVTPVLLLDDIFDKLDQSRVQRLIGLVSDNFFGQVLVTDTDEERVRAVFANNKYKIFHVNEGVVSELPEFQLNTFVDE